jgi:zona occludens toxin
VRTDDGGTTEDGLCIGVPMLGLTTGTPGAGKTLINVYDLVKLEKANDKNIILNPRIYENNLKIIQEKDLEIEFTYLIRNEGTGTALRKHCFRFCDDYFNLFAEMDRVEDYFLRSIYYNEIIERVNEDYKLKLNPIRPVRTIYTNISGLKLENIRPLPLECDWTRCPDGSYLVIDEIQNIPIFSSETRTVDDILKKLTVHRHRGFDIIGITQFPNLVHKNFIALVGHHRHLVNSFGLKSSTVFHWSTAKSDPNAFKNKATSEVKTTFRFPPELFKYYRSATAHTHKLRLPWRFIIMLGGFLFLCISLFSCSMSNDNNFLKTLVTGEPPNGKPNTQAAAAQGSRSTSAQSSSDTANNQNETASSLPASSAVSNDSPDSADRTSESIANAGASSIGSSSSVNVYDPNDPFNFKPDTSPAVVTHRVFSGCLCVQSKCYATDQQGTLLDGISQKTCRQLLDKSYNRPFDYFRQPSAVPRQDANVQENREQANSVQQQQSPVATEPVQNAQVKTEHPLTHSQSVYVPNKGYEK